VLMTRARDCDMDSPLGCAQGGRAVVAGNQELSVGGMVDSQDGDHRRPLHR
jgi:hypothetical protein